MKIEGQHARLLRVQPAINFDRFHITLSTSMVCKVSHTERHRARCGQTQVKRRSRSTSLVLYCAQICADRASMQNDTAMKMLFCQS